MREGRRAYLSDAAFEYAFGGEDLVPDLLQFHVDVAARRAAIQHTYCRPTEQRDHKYTRRRRRRPRPYWWSRRPAGRGDQPRRKLPRCCPPPTPGRTPLAATPSCLYRFPETPSLAAATDQTNQWRVYGTRRQKTKLNRSCRLWMITLHEFT